MGLPLFPLMHAHDLDSRTHAGLRNTSCQATVRLCYLCRGGCQSLVYVASDFQLFGLKQGTGIFLFFFLNEEQREEVKNP